MLFVLWQVLARADRGELTLSNLGNTEGAEVVVAPVQVPAAHLITVASSILASRSSPGAPPRALPCCASRGYPAAGRRLRQHGVRLGTSASASRHPTTQPAGRGRTTPAAPRPRRAVIPGASAGWERKPSARECNTTTMMLSSPTRERSSVTQQPDYAASQTPTRLLPAATGPVSA